MNDFNEAKERTEEMFENPNILENPNTDEATDGILAENEENTAVQEQASAQNDESLAEQNTIDEAVNLAEQATAEAERREQQIQQLMSEMSALTEQNRALQEAMNQMSEQQKQSVVSEAMELPFIDINGLAFADEDTIKDAQNEYAQKMADYIKGGIMKEMSPYIEQAKQGAYEREKAEVIDALRKIPDFEGIDTMLPRLDRMIANNSILSSDNVPIDEKYIMAYAMAKGVDAPKERVVQREPTADEIVAIYESNPEIQQLIEKKRINSVKNSQQVPPFSASSGAVNAALNIKEKPKTLEEAAKRSREMFGLNY